MMKKISFCFVLCALFFVAQSFAHFPDNAGENGENADVKVVKATILMNSGTPDDNYCHDIVIYVVVKEEAFNSPVANAIGFYSTFRINGRLSPVFPIASLKGSVSAIRQLKYGGKGLVFAFRGRGYCWVGSGSSSMYQRLEFKPYVYYEFVEDTKIKSYRKWAEGQNSWLGGGFVDNHMIARTDFDFSGDLFE